MKVERSVNVARSLVCVCLCVSVSVCQAPLRLDIRLSQQIAPNTLAKSALDCSTRFAFCNGIPIGLRSPIGN